MNTPTLVPSDAIVFHHNQVRTSSIKVAEAFGKRHADVLRKVENLDCSPDFSSANFCVDDKMISIGKGAQRQSKVYEMTKDGFVFLVMGFTGKKAAQVKEAYINEFNRMAAELEKRAYPSTPANLSSAQQRHIQQIVANLAKVPGNSFSQVYRSIKDRFNVGSYKDVPAARYPELCKYLNAAPKSEALEGELIESGQLALPHAVHLSYPARGEEWRYTFRELFNNGWNTELEPFLNKLQRMKGQEVTFVIDDVSGLIKEVRSLMMLVESSRMQMERIQDAIYSAAKQAQWDK